MEGYDGNQAYGAHAAPQAVDWGALEARDGARFSWNVVANSRAEMTKCVVPFGAVVTPRKAIAEDVVPKVPYEPVRCKGCGGALNPYARVDFASKIWVCPLCHARNHFPPHYGGLSETNLPAELFPSYTTIEYAMPSRASGVASGSGYLFVVDACVEEDELRAVKQAVTQALSLMPEDARVGLVTFGTHVHVHELGFESCPKSYVFRGNKEFTTQQVKDQLALGGGPLRAVNGARGQPAQGHVNGAMPASRFLVPLSECEFQLSAILEELNRDAFAPLPSCRRARCTGTALMVASCLLATGAIGQSARAMLFTGGAATEGGGTIVAKDMEQAVRSHKDIVKGAAPFYAKAKKYYEQVAVNLCANGHVLDVFACALDQVGLAEMKVCVEKTGGNVVLAESFSHTVFKTSFLKLFAPDTEGGLGIAYNGQFEVVTSRDVKTSGVIGPCAALDRKGLPGAVSDSPIGSGGTTAWKMCTLTNETSLAVYFEVANPGGKDQQSMAMQGQHAQQFFVQFLCTFTLPNGESRMRVITTSRRWTDGQNLNDIAAGFDQEAAAVLVARQLSWKMETEEETDCPAATRWLDRKLIALCQRFGNYRKDDPHSFQLMPQFSIYPQFMFNLRRSQFVQVFNNSPDETAYFRMILQRENVYNSLVMIQPTLTSYSFNGPPEPVLLDVCSIAADRILVLDAYFTVVVFHGMTIAQWRKANYQDQPEHVAFKELLAAPRVEADQILASRFPVPRLIDCDQHGSQARFLLAKLNPSATYNSSASMGGGSDIIFTDDVSLQVFLDHLKRLAVADN
ncbi:Zinc finger, Sec23/Sec24-type [Ostreococcus tauri]|uniref:Protein transport protein SEC23 n=1 Tax=Ostreococcus tauri TaxID=70448 RepID=Q012X1_OSTTA|nr:Zinc finger, Sec23/Sec24-type [Ostreococcus tauri]CAL55059.1 Zinc finger, Sec23/Sec24-type [Ostreococcus tauri]|eukprot:XP_003080891.1 Zinc finger, Sec23/Sec24-type [Ostreococcus tauri]